MLGGTSCSGGGPCGSHVVIVDAAPKPVDGGIDCSVCNGFGVLSCNAVTVNDNSEVACNEQDECPGGRRPATLLAAPAAARGSAGTFFASAARLEAASVVAFRVLACELAAHRAPAEIVAWCHRSAAEEVQHARLTSALARRLGAVPMQPAYSEAIDVRPLEEIAIENAMEGCARESFGAVTAVWQARHAADAAVAQSMTVIARDEHKHAELAGPSPIGASSKLTRAGRSRVTEARALAASELLDRGLDVARGGAPGGPTFRRAPRRAGRAVLRGAAAHAG